MNKLLMNQEAIILKDTTTWIAYDKETAILEIEGNVTLYEIEEGSTTRYIEIHLKENSTLTYERFGYFNQSVLVLNIISGKESHIDFRYALLANGENTIELKEQMPASNSVCKIKVHAVAVNTGKITLKASGHIASNTKNNMFSEDLKILSINEEEHTLIPNLEVETENCIANHFATIAPIEKETMFYLMSKGLKEETAINLIKNGFLLSLFDQESIIGKCIKEKLENLGGEKNE